MIPEYPSVYEQPLVPALPGELDAPMQQAPPEDFPGLPPRTGLLEGPDGGWITLSFLPAGEVAGQDPDMASLEHGGL